MEIVQQSHLHLGADGEREILKAIARDAKRRPHVVENAVGRCEALDRMKGDRLAELNTRRYMFLIVSRPR